MAADLGCVRIVAVRFGGWIPGLTTAVGLIADRLSRPADGLGVAHNATFEITIELLILQLAFASNVVPKSHPESRVDPFAAVKAGGKAQASPNTSNTSCY